MLQKAAKSTAESSTPARPWVSAPPGRESRVGLRSTLPPLDGNSFCWLRALGSRPRVLRECHGFPECPPRCPTLNWYGRWDKKLNTGYQWQRDRRSIKKQTLWIPARPHCMSKFLTGKLLPLQTGGGSTDLRPKGRGSLLLKALEVLLYRQ